MNHYASIRNLFLEYVSCRNFAREKSADEAMRLLWAGDEGREETSC